MRVVIFCHSLRSDWNHGNAHFLRGIATDMIGRGFDVQVYEPADSWSAANLAQDRGPQAVEEYRSAYPQLDANLYNLSELKLDEVLHGADLVLVHEWNDHDLVAKIGEHRKANGEFVLLFHDTHHRSVTGEESMSKYDLSGYDGVLAFGEVIRKLYVQKKWAKRAWTWHEAADPRVFHPMPGVDYQGDLVWVGNWGDEERTEELHQYLLNPVKELGLKAKVYGVRYPDHAIRSLKEAGIEYGGSLANYAAPDVFARYRMTVHVPRRPYVESLPGIPTIRMFEALACGIPLISAYWNDAENLFCAGQDYLVAKSGEEMKRHMKTLIDRPELGRKLAVNGRRTVLQNHTCSHRVDELLRIYEEVKEKEEIAVA